MNESITRAAGGANGQMFDAARMQALAAVIGRPARQRKTLYERVPERMMFVEATSAAEAC